MAVTVTDNLDGTLTILGAEVDDNGDGTLWIHTIVQDNGDGTEYIGSYPIKVTGSSGPLVTVTSAPITGVQTSLYGAGPYGNGTYSPSVFYPITVTGSSS